MVCQLRGLTVMFADNAVVAPERVAFTLTVPPVTITPDQVRLPVFAVRDTVVPLASLNCQPETEMPDDGVTVHVALAPRVTDELQLSCAAVPGSVGAKYS